MKNQLVAENGFSERRIPDKDKTSIKGIELLLYKTLPPSPFLYLFPPAALKEVKEGAKPPL